jgi:hypothetical protein
VERISGVAAMLTTLAPPPATMNGRLDSWQQVQEFIFAGNATFTLVSLKTGVRFTYKVRVKKEDAERLKRDQDAFEGGTGAPASEVTYFVNLLRGPDNESDFSYMGVLRRDPARFFWTSASGKVGRGAPAYKALVWMVDAMANGRAVLGSSLEVWHEGRCGRCGRKLTVPESVASGYGPECSRRVA